MRAVTIEGLIAKAQVAAKVSIEDDAMTDRIREDIRLHGADDHVFAVSLTRDLIRMGATL